MFWDIFSVPCLIKHGQFFICLIKKNYLSSSQARSLFSCFFQPYISFFYPALYIFQLGFCLIIYKRFKLVIIIHTILTKHRI